MIKMGGVRVMEEITPPTDFYSKKMNKVRQHQKHGKSAFSALLFFLAMFVTIGRAE